MTTMRRAVAVLVLSVMSCASTAAFAANADLTAALAGIHQRIETSDFRATGRLVQVNANGERTTYKFTMKGHWFPDGLRLLCEITEPAAARTRLLLHMSANGRMSVEEMKAGSKTVSELPFERWNEPLLGAGFSFEDMVEGQFYWKAQELQPAAKYGARDCFVIKSVPGAEDRSFYASVTSWIDRTIFYPVHVTKTVRGTGAQKDFTYFGLRQNSGVWSASQVEVKVQGRPGSSLLIIENGTEKAKLQRKDFDLTASTKGEQ
jgi:hypothetical protein